MITVYENRYVSVKNIYGTQNENNVTELEIEVPQEYENWNKRIVFITPDGNKWDLINGNIYKLKNNITKYQEVYCYIWLTKNSESEEESIDDFRSETFRLFFNKNEQADDTVPSEEQLDGFNTLINELNVALEEVKNINADIEKLKEEVTQTIEDLNTKVENGEFDGATFTPNVDEQGNISWTNDKGLENPQTVNIKGDKGDRGERGEQGVQGEIGPRGPQGEQGLQGQKGEKGDKGDKGDKPIAGVDYFTEEDKQEIVNEVTQDATNKFNQNVTAKTNEFNNNATTKTNAFNKNAETKTTQFNENASTKTEEFNQNAQNKIDEFNQNTEVFENRLTSLETNDTKQDELIDKLKGNMFNLTAEGTSINVQDASDLPAVLEVSGGERQATREGYNLFNKDSNIIMNYHLKTEDGSVEAYTNDWYQEDYIEVKSNTNYCLNSSGNNWLRHVEYDEGYNYIYGSIENSFLTKENTKYIRLSSGKDRLEQMQLVEGTEEKPYEQYGASPSPEYPSEVEVVGDNVNLFDKDNITDNYYLDKKTGNHVENSSYCYSDYIDISNIKNITISANEYPNASSPGYIFYDINKTYLSGEVIPTSQKSIVIPNNAKYFRTSILKTQLNSLKIEEGEVATSYSPYGMGSVEINKVNKNWFDTSIQSSTTLNGINIINNNDGSYKLNGTATATAYLKPMVSPKPLTEYTYICFGLPNDCLTNISYVGDVYGENIKKFTSKESLSNIQIRIPSGVTINATIRPMLIEGNSDLTISDYIPHESEVYNLPIQQPMLSGDTFVREDGNWFKVHTKGKYVFTGNESFLYKTDGTYAIYVIRSFNMPGVDVLGSSFLKSNYFHKAYNGTDQINKEKENNSINFASGTVNMRIDKFTSAEEYQNFLAEKYATENPVYMWYTLATPRKLLCTPEQTQVLEQLYNSNTYRPVTNVFTQEDLANLKLSYVADSKIYVDNKFNTLAEQLLNSIGGNN